MIRNTIIQKILNYEAQTHTQTPNTTLTHICQ